jgi:hypothetical protein
MALYSHQGLSPGTHQSNSGVAISAFHILPIEQKCVWKFYLNLLEECFLNTTIVFFLGDLQLMLRRDYMLSHNLQLLL